MMVSKLGDRLDRVKQMRPASKLRPSPTPVSWGLAGPAASASGRRGRPQLRPFPLLVVPHLSGRLPLLPSGPLAGMLSGSSCAARRPVASTCSAAPLPVSTSWSPARGCAAAGVHLNLLPATFGDHDSELLVLATSRRCCSCRRPPQRPVVASYLSNQLQPA